MSTAAKAALKTHRDEMRKTNPKATYSDAVRDLAERAGA